MKKKTLAIIIAILVVVAGAGVATALIVNNQADKNDDTTSSNTTNNESSNVDTSKTFEPKDLNSLSYVATSTSVISGQTITTVMESNGKGVLKTSSESAGMSSESYITGNDVTTCINGECTKTTVETDATSDQLTADLSKYRNNAQNAGKETIDGVSYQKWTVTGDKGDTISYYLDSSNRIARISMPSTNTTIVYEYKDVSITIPQV